MHLPILKLAISDQPGYNKDSDKDEDNYASNTQEPKVTAKLVTSATITANAIPRFSVLGKRAGPGAKEGFVLACLISQSGAFNATSGSKLAD